MGDPDLALLAAQFGNAHCTSGNIYYYHNGHLGTPQKMTDAAADVVWAADYLPFGQADVTITTVENNLRYPGQYFDAETGIHNNWYRYYDPKPGRYLRADPIGFKGKEYNLYSYSKNNPIRWTDPTGKKTEIECDDEPCLKAPGLPDDSPDCNKYGDRRYLGTSLRCFCKCAGNSAWSKNVRGCLRCMDEKGTLTGEAHRKCYKAASDAGHDRPEITLGYCYTKCLFTTK